MLFYFKFSMPFCVWLWQRAQPYFKIPLTFSFPLTDKKRFSYIITNTLQNINLYIFLRANADNTVKIKSEKKTESLKLFCGFSIIDRCTGFETPSETK